MSTTTSLDHLGVAASRWAERVALIDRDRTWTWSELDGAAAAIAARLGEHGVAAGDAVVLVLADDGPSAAAFHGSVRTGARVVLLHVGAGRAEYEDVLARVAPRVVVGPAERAPDLAELAPTWLDVADAAASAPLFDRAMTDEPIAAPAPTDAEVLLFTSGTTARAKGVRHTSASLDAAASRFLDAAALGADDRFFLVSPLSSITGVLQALVMAPRAGASVVLVDHWDDVATTDLLLDTGATFYGGPDVVLARLLTELARRDRTDLPLRAVALGGTMLDADLLARVEDLGVSVMRAYGSSEVPFSTVTPRNADRTERLTRDGRPVAGVEVRIGSGRDPREICIRGPHQLVGFLDEEDEREALRDGWYLTGDLGSMDGGSLVVEGRIKEIVIRNGVKVSLLEVERAVAALADVEAAVAFRADDPDTGEHLGVAVRRHAGTAFDGEALVGRLRDAGLATVKLPEELVDWVGPFPETASGKVRRDAVAGDTTATRWCNDRVRRVHARSQEGTST